METKPRAPMAVVLIINIVVLLAIWITARPCPAHPLTLPAPTVMKPTSVPLTAIFAEPTDGTLATPTITMSTSVPSNAAAQRILEASRQSLGEPMWTRHAHLVAGGVYGCASALTGVLHRADITDADSALVSTMRKQLLQRPGTIEILLKSPGDPYLDDREMNALLQPGDILVGTDGPLDDQNAGAAAHTAVYVSTELVYSNNSDDGLWIEASTHLLFDRFEYVSVLRLV